MTVGELVIKLSLLPREYPVRVLDNHTGDELEIEAVGTAADMDLDVADTDDANRLVIIRVEE